MTKLNYANRKSEGVKLGSTVAKDLRRRTRTPGAATAVHNPIDLNLNGKSLTDDGIEEFAQTLQEVLTPVDGVPLAKLQFLHLQNNMLTARSLWLLTPCVQAASDTLEDLDLSNNLIRVRTENQKDEWRLFLQSFARCSALRRLNLSGNDLSDLQAFETFSDIYIRQFEANAACWNQDAEHEDEVLEDLQALSVRDTNIANSLVNYDKSPSRAKMRQDVRGLPAIAVMGFEDVSMSDAGALFLSWIIERHKFAQVDHSGRLWMRSKDEPDRAAMEISGNKTLGTLGIKLLSEAETVPFHPFKHDESEDEESEFPASARRRSSVMTSASRQAPQKQVLNALEADVMQTSVRRCTQPSQIELRISRDKFSASSTSHTMLWDHPDESALSQEVGEVDPPPPGPPRPATPVDTLQATVALQPAPTYASTLRFERTRGAPVLSVVTDTRTPSSPPTVLKPKDHHRRAGSSGRTSPPSTQDAPVSGSAVATPAKELKGAILMDDDSPRMIGPLPEQAWIRVLVYMIGVESVLKDVHLDSIMKYACDRSTLAKEREYLGKSDSVQKWKVLEQMGCLMY
ncbi:MAG: hypothetical protein Q9159_001893 [Coniocarpon cinnabarinum]